MRRPAGSLMVTSSFLQFHHSGLNTVKLTIDILGSLRHILESCLRPFEDVLHAFQDLCFLFTRTDGWTRTVAARGPRPADRTGCPLPNGTAVRGCQGYLTDCTPHAVVLALTLRCSSAFANAFSRTRRASVRCIPVTHRPAPFSATRQAAIPIPASTAESPGSLTDIVTRLSLGRAVSGSFGPLSARKHVSGRAGKGMGTHKAA